MEYVLRNSLRARRITVTVRRDGTVVVTKPRFVNRAIADKFVRESHQWIEKTRAKYAPRPNTSRIESSAKEYKRMKRSAQALIEKRAQHFARIYKLEYRRITVRNQKARWGSCSREGVLSFNYRLYFLPQSLLDYVVVHEICHLQEMNHSKRFWALVAKTCPDHILLRRELRKRERHLLVD